MFWLFGSEAPDPLWPIPWQRGDSGKSWWYPVCIMLGFAIAILLGCLKLKKRYKVSIEPFYWFILIGVPVAIFGANFGSCVLGPPAGKHWSEFWTSFGTGLAIEWGVMFAVITAFIYFPLVLRSPSYRVKNTLGDSPKIQKVSMWMYFDAIIPAILIAQFIGRWGNYCNQEVYGAEVHNEAFTWFLYKVFPGMYIDGAWRQPLFFYEGMGNLAMFFILYFGIEFIKQRKAGDMAAVYFIWYGVFRACLEPLRDVGFKNPTSIVTSIVWASIGLIFILINHLLIAKTRDKKIWHTLFAFGPAEVFRMIDAGWHPQKNERYKDLKFNRCVRLESEMIYFGEW